MKEITPAEKHRMFQAPWKTEKVSGHIIETIRDSILAGRIKPNERVASEKELVEGFGVSKASVREALRVLEVMGLVDIRKGPAGGVYVAEVDMKTTINSITNFLKFTSVSIKDITMLRYLIEPAVAHLAAARVTRQDIRKLEELIAMDSDDPGSDISRDISFHRYLARMTRVPILILIMDFVDNILKDVKTRLGLGQDFYQQVKDMHRGILVPLSAGDGEATAEILIRDVLWVGEYLAPQTGSEIFDPTTFGRDFRPDAFVPSGKAISEEELNHLMGSAAATDLTRQNLTLKEVGKGALFVFFADTELTKSKE